MNDQQKQQQAWNQHINEEMKRRQQEQQELHNKVMKAQHDAAVRQQWIDEEPQRKYAIIAAIDQRGGFSKDGIIPWHYPEDFKWFKHHTTNQICVMGRSTYEDINNRLGDKAKQSVLPNRKCFVVSTTLKQDDITNATVITSPFNVSNAVSEDDHDKTIFFIGGEKIFTAGLSLADTVYLTIINKDFSCDKLFPINQLDKQFTKDKMFKNDTAPDLRFLVYKRNK